jgi:predicted ATPase
MLERAEPRGLLLVVEDAHWIDPSTLELIERCLEHIAQARMLVLVTTRPDHHLKLAGHPGVTQLSLTRLGRGSVESIMARLGGASLQAQTLATIVAQADGVPLFVEELTKAVLETGETAIPASLHGSLMARLDHIPEAKEVAQIAACIGRDFDQALVRAVAERPAVVDAALDKLTAAELVFRRGDPGNARYTFKHALVQEAAYESILHSRRQRLHARILQVLETERAGSPSETLARHAAAAGKSDKAIDYWQQAGNAALAKSAYVEATGYLGHALALIHSANDAKDRRTQELELQVRQGQACTASQGFGADDTKKAFERANELLGAVSDSPHYFPVQYGLWAWSITRAECAGALPFAHKALAAAEADGSGEGVLLGLRLVAMSHMYMGQFKLARDYFERALAVHDQAPPDPMATQFGVHQGAALFCFFSWTLRLLGHAQQSEEMLERSRKIAAKTPHVNARLHTQMQCAMVAACARDLPGVRMETAALAEHSARHRLPMYQAYAHALLAWAALESGQPAQEVVASYEQALQEIAAAGSRNLAPFFQGGLAIALAAAGRHDEALATIARALAECEQKGLGWCDAELWRVQGELLLAAPERDEAQAAESFERAITVARSRDAKLWELRATVGLARLRAEQGQRTRARSLLAAAYGWFSEGFWATDLVEARGLLGVLEQQGLPR